MTFLTEFGLTFYICIFILPITTQNKGSTKNQILLLKAENLIIEKIISKNLVLSTATA